MEVGLHQVVNLHNCPTIIHIVTTQCYQQLQRIQTYFIEGWYGRYTQATPSNIFY